MLTKILTAAIGLILALMVLRFFAGRSHRAQLRARSEERSQREASHHRADPGPHVRPDVDLDAPADAESGSRPERTDRKPTMVTTLEVDPETGVYRPKG